MAEEETLVFLKPDAVARRYTGARLLRELTDADVTVTYFGEVTPSREFMAEDHYAEHEGRFFYEWLLDYVDAGPLLVTVLSGDGVIQYVRETLGDTVIQEAAPGSLRGRYGIYGGLNAVHASDSPESAAAELESWRPLLEPSDTDPEAALTEYIETYIDEPMIDPVRYRELSERLGEGAISEAAAQEQFASLLARETDADEAVIDRLADVMVRNVTLENR